MSTGRHQWSTRALILLSAPPAVYKFTIILSRKNTLSMNKAVATSLGNNISKDQLMKMRFLFQFSG